jgi:hypothetical protein
LGRICKEAVVPGGAEKNREKARMAGVPTEIPNRNFPNKNLAFYACNKLLGEMRKKLTDALICLQQLVKTHVLGLL